VNVRFYAVLTSDQSDDRMYITRLEMYKDDDNVDESSVVELAPDVYFELYREFGHRIRVGHAHACKFYVKKGTSFVNSFDEIGKDESCGVQEHDMVDMAAEQIAKKLREWIAGTTQLVPLMLFQYMRANLVLQAADVFITDDNKEEKYLEIISKGDDKLIDALSDFLDAQDELLAKTHMLQVYQRSVDALNKAQTVQQLEEIYKTEIAPEIMRTTR